MLLEQRVDLLQNELDQVNQAASNETKSTAGDKHETARAMMHIEREKLSRQLMEAVKLQKEIARLDPADSSDSASGGLVPKDSVSKDSVSRNSVYKIVKGSLVQTDRGWLYLSVALGKIQFEGETYIVLSTESPVGKSLLGAAVKEEVAFRKTTYTILAHG